MMMCNNISKGHTLRQWFADKFCDGHQCDSRKFTVVSDLTVNVLL